MTLDKITRYTFLVVFVFLMLYPTAVWYLKERKSNEGRRDLLKGRKDRPNHYRGNK